MERHEKYVFLEWTSAIRENDFPSKLTNRQYTLQKHKTGIPICFKDINYKLSYNFSAGSRAISSPTFSVLGLTKSKSKHIILNFFLDFNL